MSASVLVVDDERAIQDTLAWCLRNDGHGVRTAGSAEEAMGIMANQGFDLIISDIIMPGLSGVDLLRKARVLQPQTLFVLITAFATVETAVEALREGASDYIVKPFKFDELRQQVRRLLEHQAAFQESARFRQAVESAVPDRSLLGESAAMLAVRTQIARTGPAVSNVLIAKILEIIKSGRACNVCYLAREFNLSKSHLQHLFKRQTGLRLGHLLTEQKLQKAAHLLKSSQMRIKQIACAVGYEHTSSFTRAFERRFAEPPQEFRRNRSRTNC
jgi:YesN/AraC family two-component response regulator